MTKKIVIHRPFGCYQLSDEAVVLYAKKKGIPLYRITQGENWYQENKWIECGPDTDIFDISYINHPLPEDGFVNWQECDDSFIEPDRDDPILVEVVEELGKAAGKGIVVVEIPDDVEWEIEEYDGAESIEEVHRSWGWG